MSPEETKALKLEVESLREELHKTNLKLETLKNSHSTEVEFLKDELEDQRKTHVSKLQKLEHDQRAKELLKDEKNNALTEELNLLRDELESVTQCNEKYKNQLEVLKTAKSAAAASSYSDYEGLKESNRTLKAQLIEKEELLEIQTEKIRKLSNEVSELRNALSELSENSEGKDGAIKEMSARIKEIEREREEEQMSSQNEILTLKEELKRLNGAAVRRTGEDGDKSNGSGGASRGNSLFSEVEERRLKVEEELKRLRDLVKTKTAENRALQIELERGDFHSASMNAQLEVITKTEQDIDKEIKRDRSETLQLFDRYRDRFDNLRSEYRRKLEQYKTLQGEPRPTTSELEKLREDRDSLLLQKMALEREMNDLKRELKYNKHLRTVAESNIKILNNKAEYERAGSKTLQLISTCNNKENDNLGVSSPESNGNDNGNEICNATVHMREEHNTGAASTPKRSMLVKKDNPEQCNQQ